MAGCAERAAAARCRVTMPRVYIADPAISRQVKFTMREYFS